MNGWPVPHNPVDAAHYRHLRRMAFERMDPLAWPGQMADWSSVYMVTRGVMRAERQDSAVTIWLGVGRPNYILLQFGVIRVHDSFTTLHRVIPDFPKPDYSRLVPRTKRKL